MEEEKKKKRNKKKKNKQSKAGEDVAVDAGETASLDQNHVSNGQDDHGQVCSETADARNDVQNMNVGLNGHQPNCSEGSILVEDERQQWLHREATLEETIRQLRNENALHVKKQVSLEETVEVIQNENALHIKKEATLEETIKQLQNENNSCIQKEAGLEEKISQLLDEKGNLVLKGASLEEKVKRLEGEKDIWISKENSTKETIASLNGDVAKLHAQVVELEEFRNNLLQENQRLTEIIPGLQSQIQNFERSISSTSSSDEPKKLVSEHEDLNSQIEAALQLVDKLITENAMLIEKVNELYVELDRRATAGLPSATLSDQMVEAADTASVADTVSESNENLSVTGKKLESVEIVPVKVENIGSDDVDVEHAAAIPNSLVSDEPGEIVQISLDENEVRDLELQAANNDEIAAVSISDAPLIANNEEKDAVPISDAPLIGAPFRLISFVAKYVSGADLVSKSSSN
ncbi:uncharacterized protein LOC132191556 isoform X2 [Corylus avellana]|uniref:uncharacterized protein LOC132191556 isoform X2 n=1 Tax=Corylus avellana TaxID=13451 RepID=UPI00286BF9A6|nr:uncharacterized protein LOC132191556 isoform X2 [Corylus avellana]